MDWILTWLFFWLVLVPTSSLVAFDVISVLNSALIQCTFCILLLTHVAIRVLGRRARGEDDSYDEASDDGLANKHALFDDDDMEYVDGEHLSDYGLDEQISAHASQEHDDAGPMLVFVHEHDAEDGTDNGIESEGDQEDIGGDSSAYRREARGVGNKGIISRACSYVPFLLFYVPCFLASCFFSLLRWAAMRKNGRAAILYVADVYVGIRTHYCIVAWYLLASLVLSFSLTLLSCHSCLTMNPHGFSTGFLMRLYPQSIVSDSNSLCEWDSVCHIYLTVPRDMSTSMILNFHTRSHRPGEAYIKLRALGNETQEERVIEASWIHMDNIALDERYQFWVDLFHLEPDSAYEAEILVMSVNGRRLLGKRGSETSIRFRTGPSAYSDRGFVFASGGDMQWSRAGVALATRAASEAPLFVLVGGDIAYENGMSGCYLRMDEWFYNYNRYMKIEPGGYSIPILTAIGNHETGGFRRRREDAAFYFKYFPHELNTSIGDRSSYHEHLFSGHTYLVILDSYVSSPIGGRQVQWLRERLDVQKESVSSGADARRVHRIAAYHASAYPVVRRELRYLSEDIRVHWVPLFEEYAFGAALEHHYHALQITKPIFNNTVNLRRGVTYMGSGAWGVPPRMDIDTDSWWVERAISADHIFVTSCDSDYCMSLAMVYNTDKDCVLSLDGILF